MYSDTNMEEVAAMIKNNRDMDLQLNTFATISGIRGKQFGKEVYATLLKFKDLVDFLQVFPDVQRDIKRNKVVSMRKYILSGLDNLGETMRFFPAITVTARGHIFYDEPNHNIAIDTNNAKLSVNDGQHRFFAVNEAIEELKNRLEKTPKTEEDTRYTLKRQIEELSEMVLPMTIFSGLSERGEKQLFHDTNNLAQRPSKSAVIRLVQTDYISRIARELATENRYLGYLGVETDKGSIQKVNPNTFLLTTIHHFVQRLLWDNRNSVDKENFEECKQIANEALDRVFFNLPADLNVKGKYILDKSYTMKAIGIFIQKHRKNEVPDDAIFQAIKEVNWDYDIKAWERYNGHLTRQGFITFGSSGQHGELAVMEALEEKLSKES